MRLEERQGNGVHAFSVGGLGTTFECHVDEHEGSVIMPYVFAGLEVAKNSERGGGGACEVELGALRGL